MVHKKRGEIIRLIENDVSIPKISKRLNVGKSTIYYHYKKIKGRKYQKARIPEDDEVLGEFLGIFAGDGSFIFEKKYSHYKISISLHAVDDKDYAEYIRGLIRKNFNKIARQYVRSNINSLTIEFYSKDIYGMIKEYLNIYPNKTYDVHIKRQLDSLSDKFLISFTRGIVDTDGCHKKDGRIVLCLTSKEMINQVSLILKNFEIGNKVYIRRKKLPSRTQYELTIPKRYVNRYISYIGFSNKRKLNARAEI